jgi:hypothetical protein
MRDGVKLVGMSALRKLMSEPASPQMTITETVDAVPIPKSPILAEQKLSELREEHASLDLQLNTLLQIPDENERRKHRAMANEVRREKLAVEDKSSKREKNSLRLAPLTCGKRRRHWLDAEHQRLRALL